jgi:cobalamin synthase
MNFSGVSKAEQLLLVLHDQVVGPLGVVAVACVVLGRVGPAALLVDGEVAVVHSSAALARSTLVEQALVGRQLGRARYSSSKMRA